VGPFGRLLPLFVAVAVVGVVARAARSPLEAPRQTAPAGVPAASLGDVVSQIDRALEENWRTRGLTAAEAADDLTVLRRLALALFGTGPSLEEIRAFEDDARPDRLHHRVRQMLADTRFSDYFAERLARACVGNEDGQFIVYRRDRFVRWLSAQLHEGRPFDQIVYSMISETGLWTGRPATNFVTAAVANEDLDENKLAGRTVRAFLGQRIDCAQCHDHPFASWKQHEFEGLASFFGQVQTSLVGIEDKQMRDGTPVEYEVEDRKTREKRVVVPAVPFHSEWLPDNGSRRERLAGWVVHRQNRRFERAIANRVWGMMFGRPYHDPVDDLPDPADDSHDLLDILGRDFREHGCDLRRLVQVIAATRPFRMTSQTAAKDSFGEASLAVQSAEAAWAVFPLVRLRPEQVIGAILQSSSVQTADQNSHWVFRAVRLLQGGQFVREYGDLGDNELVDRGGTIPQRLLLMNGELADGASKGGPISSVGRIARFASTDARAVEAAYLLCLTRRPGAEELAWFGGQLAGTTGEERRKIVEDLVWTLFNSTEFAWNH
jgi:hypothetical protein